MCCCKISSEKSELNSCEDQQGFLMESIFSNSRGSVRIKSTAYWILKLLDDSKVVVTLGSWLLAMLCYLHFFFFLVKKGKKRENGSSVSV